MSKHRITAKDEISAAPSARRGLLGWIDAPLLIFIAVCAVLTLAGAVIQSSFGAYDMTMGVVWQSIFSADIWLEPQSFASLILGIGELPSLDRETLIVWNIRLPRVFSAVFVGANLAVSGAIFQAVTRNELASPYILGVSSGAGFALLLTLLFMPALIGLLPFMAALGGIIAFLLVYAIAWQHGGTDPVRMVLAGVIVGTVFGSLQTGMLLFLPDLEVVKSVIDWTTGSLIGNDWQDVRVVLPWTVPIMFLTLLSARQLNVLLLGEETARSLGMSVEKVRFLLCVLAIGAASVSVAVAGLVGFVGLIVPHIVRTCVGSDYKRVIIGCMAAGPALLVLSDTAARLVLSPTQVPVGIVTGIVGGLYFLYLMKRRKNLGLI